MSKFKQWLNKRLSEQGESPLPDPPAGVPKVAADQRRTTRYVGNDPRASAITNPEFRWNQLKPFLMNMGYHASPQGVAYLKQDFKRAVIEFRGMQKGEPTAPAVPPPSADPGSMPPA